MRLSDTWRTIGDSLAVDCELPHVQPMAERAPIERGQSAPSWRVLFGDSPRSLVVPAQDRRAQRSSVKFFITNPVNRLYAQLLLRANRLLPRLRPLPELTLPPTHGPTLLDMLPLPNATQVAFQIGTPGPYQKAAMLIMGDGGSPLAVTKIALKESADDMVVRETQWLRELGDHERLQGMVPRLLAHGNGRNGRGYLSLSVVHGGATTNVFTPAHAAFLKDLAQVETLTLKFSDSPVRRYIIDTFARLAPGMPLPTYALLLDALTLCGERLADWNGPFVLAHGDFAPWNVRVQDGEIFVFDWEYAADGSFALQDIFHFHLAPQALSGHVGVGQLRAALARAQQFARVAHPQFKWRRSTVAAQCLGYLLHTVLYYSASREHVMHEHPVIRAYCELIEERGRWIG